MSFRNKLRSILPRGLWQTIGFCKRLPIYWRLDRSNDLRVLRNVEGPTIFLSPDLFVHIPESLTSFIDWRDHGIEDSGSATETADFLALAQGRSALIDIGAQTGFLSSVFARSRKGPAHILSVEPDPQVHDILRRARTLNGTENIQWSILEEAISDHSGPISILTCTTLHEAQIGSSRVGIPFVAPSLTLTSLLDSLDWEPDLIKIDVESYEYEILMSSLPILERIRPALQLEVHWELLAARNVNAMDFLEPLSAMGYRGIRRRYRGLPEWRRESRSATVSRLSLCSSTNA